MNSNIIVTGDVHGEWNKLNDLINKKKPDIILQCGDFGIFPKFHDTSVLVNDYSRSNKKWMFYDAVKPSDTKVYTCGGNHDDWTYIQSLDNPEIYKNVFIMDRGKLLTLPDGRTVMFVGGATSIDKQYRIAYHDYWPEENINYRELFNILDNINQKIDIVISHTIPKEFLPQIEKKIYVDKRDPTNDALSEIYQKYKPALWYAAHWHFHHIGTYGDTRFEILSNCEGSHRWWNYLK
jgi:Icc-related predicted phosphoesterase